MFILIIIGVGFLCLLGCVQTLFYSVVCLNCKDRVWLWDWEKGYCKRCKLNKGTKS